jgi:hypothetical protein
MIGCNASNLMYIELGQRKPKKRIEVKIQTFISEVKNKNIAIHQLI